MKKKLSPLFIIFIVIAIVIALYLLTTQQFSAIGLDQPLSKGNSISLDAYKLTINIVPKQMTGCQARSDVIGGCVCGAEANGQTDSYGCPQFTCGQQYQSGTSCIYSGSKASYCGGKAGYKPVATYACRSTIAGGPILSKATDCIFTADLYYNNQKVMIFNSTKPGAYITSVAPTYFKNGNITTDTENIDMQVSVSGGAFENGACTYVYAKLDNLKNPCKNINCSDYCGDSFTKYQGGSCVVLNDTNYMCNYTISPNSSFCVPTPFHEKAVVSNDSVVVLKQSMNTASAGNATSTKSVSPLYIIAGIVAVSVIGIIIFRRKKK
jgi:hypothetical protein